MAKKMNLAKAEKKQLVENKMKGIAREAYNQGLNLKMYEAYGERDEVVNATKGNIEKQEKAYAALEKELAAVEALKE